VRPDCETLTLLPGEPAAPVQIESRMEDTPVAVEAKLTTHRRVLRPHTATVRPLLSARDRLPDGRPPFELLVEYRFTQREPGRVTPRFPLDDGLLYDSPFAGHVWMLYDANRRLIAVDDIRPDSVQLAKGEHVLRLVLRHDDAAKLETAKDAVLWLDRPLKSPLSLTAYPTHADAVAGSHPLGSRVLNAGERLTAYVAAPKGKLPGECEPGDVLLGRISYGEESRGTIDSGPRPGGYELRYIVPAAKATSPATGSGGATTEKGLAKEIYELRVEQLERLGEEQQELFDKLADELEREHPDDLRIPVARLKRLDDPEHRKERLSKVVEAADAILARIDAQALAAHYGTNVNDDDPQAKAERRRMDEQRAILVDTLYRKGRALGYMELPDVVEKHPIEDQTALDAAFEANFAELAKWVDTTAADYFLLHDRRERRQERYGKALELLNRHIPNSEPDYWHFKKRRDIYGELGWKHLQAWEASWLVRRFPKAYEPF
jgi:tripeptidyl-peptidase-2